MPVSSRTEQPCTPSPLPNVQELELLAFETPQTEAFVQVWFGAEAQETSQFLTMLRQNHQVRGLARIPLILALMCRAYQEQHLSFPTRRVELYDHCLQGLLRDWKEEKERRCISDIRLMSLLSRLGGGALRLYEEQREQFTELQLATALDFDLEDDIQAKQAEMFIEELKLDGILITAGEGREAPLLFLHRTFHEYLVARVLAQRANNKGWWSIAKLIDKKAWLPVWQEIIVLLAGQLWNPNLLLELLANEKKDDYFRHRLALAALCLPELTSNSSSLISNLVNHIASATFISWWHHDRKKAGAAVYHLGRALPALAQVNIHIRDKPLLNLLCRWLQNADEHVRESAATAIGQMGEVAARHPEVIPALVAALDDRNKNVRCRVAEALGQMGEVAARHPEVIPALAENLVWCSYFYDEARRVEKALEQIGEAVAFHPEVIPALFERALSNTSQDISRNIKFALRPMSKAVARHPKVIHTLVTALRDEDKHVRSDAIWILYSMGEAIPHHLEVISALVTNLHHGYRKFVVQALGQMGRAAAQPEVLSALSAALHDPERAVRKNAAEALGQMGRAAAQPEVLSALSAALHDPDGDVRVRAAEALGQMGGMVAQPEVLSTLLAALHDPDGDVRVRAAEALGQMGGAAAQPEVLSTLLAALHDPYWYIGRVCK